MDGGSDDGTYLEHVAAWKQAFKLYSQGVGSSLSDHDVYKGLLRQYGWPFSKSPSLLAAESLRKAEEEATV